MRRSAGRRTRAPSRDRVRLAAARRRAARRRSVGARGRRGRVCALERRRPCRRSPRPTRRDLPGRARRAGLADHDLEPALPDEARSRVAAEAASRTPRRSRRSVGGVLHVHFARASARGGVRGDRGDHAIDPRAPRRHPGRRPRPARWRARAEMPLGRRVAYDAELLAEVRRRLGEGIVDLRLGGGL